MAERKGGAEFSDCGLYRYKLERVWDRSLPRCAFVMLNPSTADAEQDDPTIRRCVAFAKAWGYGALEVYNIFALRSTDPKCLYGHADPVGPENDAYLAQAASCPRIVAAWGMHGSLKGRGVAVRRIFTEAAVPLLCLGKTSTGHPRHPLYVPGDMRVIPLTAIPVPEPVPEEAA